LLAGEGAVRLVENPVHFEVVGQIVDLQIVASGRGVRQRRRLMKTYGGRRWRKCKGIAKVRLADKYDLPS